MAVLGGGMNALLVEGSSGGHRRGGFGRFLQGSFGAAGSDEDDLDGGGEEDGVADAGCEDSSEEGVCGKGVEAVG
jgi:hypothetical protein